MESHTDPVCVASGHVVASLLGAQFTLHHSSATTIEKEAPKLDEQQFDGARQRVDGKPQVCPEHSEG